MSDLILAIVCLKFPGLLELHPLQFRALHLFTVFCLFNSIVEFDLAAEGGI